jgi:hypothetical protein
MTTATVPAETVACRRCGVANHPDAQRCQQCSSFLPANTLAVVHGARAGRELEAATALAARDIDEALSAGPGLEPRYLAARSGAARALARTRNLTEYLDRNGWLDGKGRPRPATKLLESAESTLLAYLRELGMTPASAAKLGVSLKQASALDAQADLADARAIAARRRAGLEPTEPKGT